MLITRHTIVRCVLAALCWLLFIGTKAQGPPPLDVVQAVIIGDLNETQVRTAMHVLHAIPGEEMSRIDSRSRNLYMHVKPDCAISRHQLSIYLAPLGLHVRCYVRGPLTSAPYHELDQRSCEPAPLRR